MEEIKKINDDNLDDVSGGSNIPAGCSFSPCFRCGGYDRGNAYAKCCDFKWYGQACCEDCLKILKDLEQKGYLSDSIISAQLRSLQDSIDNLSKK